MTPPRRPPRQPQFELQVALSTEHDTGYSLAAYGTLVDGDVNAAVPDPEALRGVLYWLMDGVVDRAKEWRHGPGDGS